MTQGCDQENSRSVELSILSDPKNLAVARTATEKMARQEGFSPNDVDAIVLAIDEALANVMRHGYEGRKNCHIRIRLEAVSDSSNRGGMRITVLDRGRQVDPDVIKGRDLEDIRPGGLGVHIIRTVMDHVEYRCRDEGGMELRMTKYVQERGETSS